MTRRVDPIQMVLIALHHQILGTAPCPEMDPKTQGVVVLASLTAEGQPQVDMTASILVRLHLVTRMARHLQVVVILTEVEEGVDEIPIMQVVVIVLALELVVGFQLTLPTRLQEEVVHCLLPPVDVMVQPVQGIVQPNPAMFKTDLILILTTMVGGQEVVDQVLLVGGIHHVQRQGLPDLVMLLPVLARVILRRRALVLEGLEALAE